jgi:hypothetical protein
MEFGSGIISKIYGWVWHPGNSEGTVMDWGSFLILILMVSFLWSTVIRQVD